MSSSSSSPSPPSLQLVLSIQQQQRLQEEQQEEEPTVASQQPQLGPPLPTIVQPQLSTTTTTTTPPVPVVVNHPATNITTTATTTTRSTTTTTSATASVLPIPATTTTTTAVPPPPPIRKYLCHAPRPEEWDKHCAAMTMTKPSPRNNTNALPTSTKHNISTTTTTTTTTTIRNSSTGITKQSLQTTLQQLYQLHPQFQCYFNTKNSSGSSNSSNTGMTPPTTTATTTNVNRNDGPIIPSTSTTTTTTLLPYENENATTTTGTIPQLRRTGPGRKSNAEYAIQFYEYALQQFNNDEDDDDDDDDAENDKVDIATTTTNETNGMDTAENRTAVDRDHTKHSWTAENGQPEVHDDNRRNENETTTTTTTITSMKEPPTNTDIVMMHHDGTAAAATAVVDVGPVTTTIRTPAPPSLLLRGDTTIIQSTTPITTKQPLPPPSNTTTTTSSRRHNSYCEVCGQPVPPPQQEIDTSSLSVVVPSTETRTVVVAVVTCSTCPKVFHTHCVRPKWDETTALQSFSSSAPFAAVQGVTEVKQHDDYYYYYQCAYCILATYKRNDRHRKQAAAGVRFMARLRKQHCQAVATAVVVGATTSTGPAIGNGGNDGGVGSNIPAPFTASGSNINVMHVNDVDDGNDVDHRIDDIRTDSHVDTAVAREDAPNEMEASLIASSAAPTDATEIVVVRQQKGISEDMNTKMNDSTTITVATGTTFVNQRPVRTSVAVIPETLTGIPVAVAGETTTPSTSPSRISQRCRKQPTLYNPQDGPASRWQTDELTEWKLQRAKEDEEEDAKIQALKAATMEHSEDNVVASGMMFSVNAQPKMSRGDKQKDGSGGMVCNFCHDNPNIPVCVFCACRVCFGKHCQTELLLCDNCDDEYHIFCLDPPLQSVPASNQPWYCVNCTVRGKNDPTLRPSRRGGDRINSVDHHSTPVPVSTWTNNTDNCSPSSRRSLRSPKLSTAALSMLSNMKETIHNRIFLPAAETRENKIKNTGVIATKKLSATTTTVAKPMKRPRGRPPKIDSSMYGNSEHRSNTIVLATANSKGTSKSASSNSASSPIKRRPGRPPRSLAETNTVIDQRPKIAAIQLHQQLGQVRKRGRPPSAETLAKRAKLEAMTRKVARQHAKGMFTSASTSSLSVTAPEQLSINKRNSNEGMTMPVSVNTTPSATMDHTTNIAPVHVVVSRSGRTVRRSNFHDELVETEQHLKSGRYGSSNHNSPSPSPRNISSVVNTTIVPLSESYHAPAAASLQNDRERRLSASNLSISNHSWSGTTSGPPTVNSQIAGDATTTQSEVTYLFDSSSMKIPANTLASNMTGSSNMDHGGYDDNESFDHDDMSITYATTDLNVQDDVEIATDGTGVAQGQQPQSYYRHQEQVQNMLDASKQPRRKPGARECMQISRRFGVKEIPQQYMDILLDYCNRGKVEHLIRMRERLDEHSRFLEMQLAGLELLVLENGESDIVVPLAPPSPDRRHE